MKLQKLPFDLKKCETLIIGTGPVGIAFAQAFRQKKISLIGVAGRQKKKAIATAKKLNLPPCLDYVKLASSADFILIAVKDEAIPEVADQLHAKGNMKPGTVLAHVSGALTSDILKRPKSSILAFSLHPLQSFAAADGNQSKLFHKTAMIFEGDEKTSTLARQLCTLLGGTFIRINPDKKVIYHTAATMAGNFLATLAFLAAALNEKAGISPNQALEVLFPLLSGTLENLKKFGLPLGLTGPIQRGDSATIQKHLEALKKVSPNLIELYKLMSLETLKLARSKGLSAGKARILSKLLRSRHE